MIVDGLSSTFVWSPTTLNLYFSRTGLSLSWSTTTACWTYLLRWRDWTAFEQTKKGNSCLIIVNCKGKWKWIVDGEYRESETKTFVSSWTSTIWAALSGKAGWFQENGEGQEICMFIKLFRWKKWQTWILWHHHTRFLVARKMTLHGNGCVPFDLCLSYPVPSYP